MIVKGECFFGRFFFFEFEKKYKFALDGFGALFDEGNSGFILRNSASLYYSFPFRSNLFRMPFEEKVRTVFLSFGTSGKSELNEKSFRIRQHENSSSEIEETKVEVNKLKTGVFHRKAGGVIRATKECTEAKAACKKQGGAGGYDRNIMQPIRYVKYEPKRVVCLWHCEGGKSLSAAKCE